MDRGDGPESEPTAGGVTDLDTVTDTDAVTADGETGAEGVAGAEGVTDATAGGVALFVDGPNVLREEFDVDLDDVRRAGEAEGPLVITRLYLDEHATPGLIQAAEARGFEVVITSGDVDVKLAVDAARFAAEGRMDTLAIASRDTDFKPVVETANGYGIRTLAIAPGEFGRSDALRNAANGSVTLDGDTKSGSVSDEDETTAETSSTQ
ncbi:NYN domain-containing protein [Halorubrum terrestre]|uniref:NYN domain-containing protein n=1 Tax=Halorubrum distributum TaxID=29283 RepID=A0A6B1IP35_9EURY|nr:NYN domain-containing protein [Halorubrum terrestre]MYL17460.1 NYN domain-containing protein [Halorubrum terrestre]